MKAGLIALLRTLIARPVHKAALAGILPGVAVLLDLLRVGTNDGPPAFSPAHWTALFGLAVGGSLADLRAPLIGSLAAFYFVGRGAADGGLPPAMAAACLLGVIVTVALQSRSGYHRQTQDGEFQRLSQHVGKMAALDFQNHDQQSPAADEAGLAGQLQSSSTKLASLFGDLGGALSYMSEMNSRLENSARVFIDSTENQNEALEESTGAVREVLGAVDEIKNSVNFAVASASEIQNTAGALLSSITGIQASMQEFADLSQSLGERTTTASRTIDSTIQAMESIQDSSARIGSILDTITDISDQTNLLALNASIEAARAGDAGRGFAVVADHISRLAERTNSSVQDIGRLTEETRAAVTRGGAEVRELNLAIQSTVAGTSGIQNSAAAAMQGLAEQLDRIRSINDSLTKFDDHSTFVQNVAGEQKKSVDLLNDKMVNLMLEIQNVASGSQDLMTISQEMGRWTEHIREALGRVRTG